jgi:glycosyltransferase involved in cell wall biosynthesis
MKIAVNAWFHDSPTNGSGQYIRHLIAAMATIAPEVQFELVQPTRHDDLSKVWFEQVTFARAAERMRADIAFVPYWAPPLRCAVPVVTTIHDVIPLALGASLHENQTAMRDYYRGKAQHRAYYSLVRAGAAQAREVLTDSEHSKRDIVRFLSVAESRVTAVPLAADARFMPADNSTALDDVRVKYGLPEAYVLYLGSLEPRKNIETVLQVFVWCGETIGHEYPLALSARADDVAYTSDGSTITIGAMLRELELEDVVHLIGKVDEADKPAIYAGARCFLFPSLYEGFGLPMLEAMACGVPVVGSNASSLPEVTADAAMLMEPMDARRMAGAVIAACTDDDLHDRMAQRGLMRAAQFSWQRTALETLAVFRSVAGE